MAGSTHINPNHKMNGVDYDEESYQYAGQILNSCALPMVLKATIDLGVLQLLGQADDHDGGLSPAQLAAGIQAQNPDAPAMLDRMLRLLATYDVVRCTATPTGDGGFERRYGPAPVTKHFVPDEDGLSCAATLTMLLDKVLLQSWSKLKDAVMEGGVPFNEVYGMHAFEYHGTDPRFNEVFNKAMHDESTYTIKRILNKYKGFSDVKQLVDVGGGLGHALRVITSHYPSLKGINFDLPHVIEHAPPIPGVEHVSGSMFESVPKGDAIFMKWILHDWSDEKCVELLKNCQKALPENGKVVAVEMNIMDQAEMTPIARAVCQLDVSMMTYNPGGKERTRREFEILAKSAGFLGLTLFAAFVACGSWSSTNDGYMDHHVDLVINFTYTITNKTSTYHYALY